ncbi:MAG: TnpV protein [Clostridia bacterium]|nr:TnpV protein [Clostridia bacterium]
MFDTLVEQMKEVEGVTEQLKEENQMEWIARMNNIDAQTKEIVGNDMIYI